MGRFKTLGAIGLLLTASGLLCAPPALANSRDLGDAGSIVSPGTDPVDKALDKANKTSDETTDAVDKNTDNATDTVDDATGGSEGDRVDEVVHGTTRTIDENVGHLTGPNGPVRKIKQDVKHALEEVIGKATGEASSIAGGGTTGSVTGPRAGSGEGADRLSSTGIDQAVDSGPGAAVGEFNNSESSTSETAAPSFVEQIERGVEELLRAAAFPLVLAALIAGFLLIQNRIDSRDPKLTLSAIDTDQNFLSFR
jgi:hypothetical protein